MILLVDLGGCEVYGTARDLELVPSSWELVDSRWPIVE